jgi:hypothetical protein
MNVHEALAGGDRRSIGRATEVVAAVLAEPALLPALAEGLDHPDPLVRMRCADALEKVTARRWSALRPYKERLLSLLARSDQQEVRWHLAQMVPRLELSREEQHVAVAQLWRYLDDRSRIVRTCALQALADLAMREAALRPRVVALVEECIRSGSPAMQSRGRKLLTVFVVEHHGHEYSRPPHMMGAASCAKSSAKGMEVGLMTSIPMQDC